MIENINVVNNNDIVNDSENGKDVVTMTNVNMTVEEIIALAEAKGLKVKTPKEKKVNYGKYNVVDGVPHCLACGKEVNYSEISDEAKKNGICEECLAVIANARKIQSSLKTTRKVVNGGKEVGRQFLETLQSIVWTDEALQELQDATFSKDVIKMIYPVLIDVTDKDEQEIKELKIVNGRQRYYAKLIHLNERSYLVCNNIFDKQLNALNEYIFEDYHNGEKDIID